jgi:ADP-heptose:LPS heptosyltransferase
VSGRAADGREWVLAIRLRQLGDVLAALEVVRAVRAARRERRVAYMVDRPYASLVRGFEFVDRVLVPPRGEGMRSWARFLAEVGSLGAAATLDFHGSARSAMITLASRAPLRVGFDVRVRRRAYTVVEARAEWRDGRRVPYHSIAAGMRLARHVGAGDAEGIPPAIARDETAVARAFARLVDAGVPADAIRAGALIGLNPGRPVPVKAWEPARFAELARRLARAGCAVVVFWGPGEEDAARGIVRQAGPGAVLGPRFALDELPAALANLAGLVTIDSGLKHLAVCARVPTVTLFGSTDPREWHMGTARDRVLWRGLSCSPCRRLECPFGAPCMDIGVESVQREILAVARRAA